MAESVGTPVAVQRLPETQRAAGRDTLPPEATSSLGGELDGFHKIAAERRGRISEPPLEVPFGARTIRIYRSMPAGFAIDAAEAEVDPTAAKRMLRSAIVETDREAFDAIMQLPPDNPEGIDGTFLIEFLGELGKLYGGVPLDG